MYVYISEAFMLSCYYCC